MLKNPVSGGLAPTCAALALVLCAESGSAVADVYKWVDAQGRTHYSDTPPDPAVAKSQMMFGKSNDAAPAAAPAAAKPGDTATPNPKTEALRGKMIGVEQVDNSPEAQRKREEACQRMRTEATLLGSDNRVFTLDDKGERSYLDDDTRAARSAELQQQISAGCK